MSDSSDSETVTCQRSFPGELTSALSHRSTVPTDSIRPPVQEGVEIPPQLPSHLELPTKWGNRGKLPGSSPKVNCWMTESGRYWSGFILTGISPWGMTAASTGGSQTPR